MSKSNNLTDFLKDIANTIRSKKNKTGNINPQDFSSEISSIVTPNNQNKTVTPSESKQTINCDTGYTGLGTVTVNAISSTYVGSGVSKKSSSDLTASGATVTVPAGYYASQASKAIANATTGKVQSGTLVETITPTINPQYVSISAGYTSAKYWKINPITSRFNGASGHVNASSITRSNTRILIQAPSQFTINGFAQQEGTASDSIYYTAYYDQSFLARLNLRVMFTGGTSSSSSSTTGTYSLSYGSSLSRYIPTTSFNTMTSTIQMSVQPESIYFVTPTTWSVELFRWYDGTTFEDSGSYNAGNEQFYFPADKTSVCNQLDNSSTHKFSKPFDNAGYPLMYENSWVLNGTIPTVTITIYVNGTAVYSGNVPPWLINAKINAVRSGDITWACTYMNE